MSTRVFEVVYDVEILHQVNHTTKNSMEKKKHNFHDLSI